MDECQREPGTVLTDAVRRTGGWAGHRPVETTTVNDLRPTAVCAGCGRTMAAEDGAWSLTGRDER
ncbi:hypothetical protein ACFYUY_23655 [Kitasatospora sp. NPDC004745]|uniref:hypothetical protein n=1 Tax=Kitasatospora sp. NPDC004745 TaxID=3364019 RepID=UPI00367700E6